MTILSYFRSKRHSQLQNRHSNFKSYKTYRSVKPSCIVRIGNQRSKKRVNTITVTSGDTKYSFFLNANTVPKLPNSFLRFIFDTTVTMLILFYQARAPYKNPPPFAYEGIWIFPQCCDDSRSQAIPLHSKQALMMGEIE